MMLHKCSQHSQFSCIFITQRHSKENKYQHYLSTSSYTQAYLIPTKDHSSYLPQLPRHFIPGNERNRLILDNCYHGLLVTDEARSTTYSARLVSAFIKQRYNTWVG